MHVALLNSGSRPVFAALRRYFTTTARISTSRAANLTIG